MLNRIVVAAARMPQRIGVMIVMALAVPQLYLLPAGTIDVPLSTVAALALAPAVAARTWSTPGARLLRSALAYSLLVLLLARLAAFAWSPDSGDGRLPTMLLVQFLVTLVLLDNAAREDPRLLYRAHYLLWPFVVAQSVLVAVFQLFPDVEDAYLRSVAGYFAGQNTVNGLFDVNRNNVLDPGKAGGVFVNGNVAGLFLGVCAMAAFAIWSVTRQRIVLICGLVAYLGVWFTGSKACRVLAVVLPLAVVATYYWQIRMGVRARRLLLIAVGATAVLAVLLVTLGDGGGFLGAVRTAFGQRTDIWGYAAQAFRDGPVLGLGWGGWFEGFADYARRYGIYDDAFPPHNILLAAWASTGLLGLAATIGFFVVEFRLVARAVAGGTPGNAMFVAWTGAAVAWVCIQAMGENTDVFGDIHTIPVLALLLCYLVHLLPEEVRRVRQTERRDSAPPAVPAVRDVHPGAGAGDARVPAALCRPGSGEDDAAGR
ncbi:O-antigen ligase family protein [Micromonospora sp. LOL_021]|uniref:O-antigen ligase family protein n=1 Tax=Micromonospora sp. LOL_021 TaxID=3345417 RepID=UPI003A849E4C